MDDLFEDEVDWDQFSLMLQQPNASSSASAPPKSSTPILRSSIPSHIFQSLKDSLHEAKSPLGWASSAQLTADTHSKSSHMAASEILADFVLFQLLEDPKPNSKFASAAIAAEMFSIFDWLELLRKGPAICLEHPEGFKFVILFLYQWLPHIRETKAQSAGGPPTKKQKTSRHDLTLEQSYAYVLGFCAVLASAIGYLSDIPKMDVGTSAAECDKKRKLFNEVKQAAATKFIAVISELNSRSMIVVGAVDYVDEWKALHDSVKEMRRKIFQKKNSSLVPIGGNQYLSCSIITLLKLWDKIEEGVSQRAIPLSEARSQNPILHAMDNGHDYSLEASLFAILGDEIEKLEPIDCEHLATVLNAYRRLFGLAYAEFYKSLLLACFKLISRSKTRYKYAILSSFMLVICPDVIQRIERKKHGSKDPEEISDLEMALTRLSLFDNFVCFYPNFEGADETVVFPLFDILVECLTFRKMIYPSFAGNFETHEAFVPFSVEIPHPNKNNTTLQCNSLHDYIQVFEKILRCDSRNANMYCVKFFVEHAFRNKLYFHAVQREVCMSLLPRITSPSYNNNTQYLVEILPLLCNTGAIKTISMYIGLDAFVVNLYRIVLPRLTMTGADSRNDKLLAGSCLYAIFHIYQVFGDFHDRLPDQITGSAQYAEFVQITNIRGTPRAQLMDPSSLNLSELVTSVLNVLLNTKYSFGQAKDAVKDIFSRFSCLTVMLAMRYILQQLIPGAADYDLPLIKKSALCLISDSDYVALSMVDAICVELNPMTTGAVRNNPKRTGAFISVFFNLIMVPRIQLAGRVLLVRALPTIESLPDAKKYIGLFQSALHKHEVPTTSAEPSRQLTACYRHLYSQHLNNKPINAEVSRLILPNMRKCLSTAGDFEFLASLTKCMNNYISMAAFEKNSIKHSDLLSSEDVPPIGQRPQKIKVATPISLIETHCLRAAEVFVGLVNAVGNQQTIHYFIQKTLKEEFALYRPRKAGHIFHLLNLAEVSILLFVRSGMCYEDGPEIDKSFVCLWGSVLNELALAFQASKEHVPSPEQTIFPITVLSILSQLPRPCRMLEVAPIKDILQFLLKLHEYELYLTLLDLNSRATRLRCGSHLFPSCKDNVHTPQASSQPRTLRSTSQPTTPSIEQQFGY